MIIQDLDVLRPESKFVKINGKQIDVSFIPCGITFDIDSIMQELGSMTQKEIESEPEKTKKAFDLSVKLCATFCEHNYPELNEKWFRNNTDALQIKAFADAIKTALTKAYAGIESYPKNAEAPESQT